LNDVDIQLVEVDDVLEISENFREVLNQEKEKIVVTSEQPTQHQKVSKEQKNEVINKGKVEKEIEFQHLEEESGLWSMDFDGAVGKDDAGIRI